MTLADQVIIRQSIRFITLEQRTQRNIKTLARLCCLGNAPTRRRGSCDHYQCTTQLPEWVLLYRPSTRQQILFIRHLNDSLRSQKLQRRAFKRSPILAADDARGSILHTRHKPKTNFLNMSSGLLLR